MDYRDYRAETELGALARDLLSDLERVRPGLIGATSAMELHEAARARADVRLGELYRESCGDPDIPDESQKAQLVLYRREIDQILLPRYAALAFRQNQEERRRSDSYNRAAYAVLFFVLGIFIVWAPFIPIWEKWVPFVMAAVAPFVSPLLPDLHRLVERRRYKLQVITLLIDLDQAGKALPAHTERPS